LRRAVPSFTIEVRRRPRLATASNPDAQSPETKPRQAAFDRESHRVAAAAFAANKTDPSPVDVASSPRGRILPSLVADEPLRRPLQDAAPTPAESAPPSSAPKRRDQASKSPRNSSFSSDENAPLADGLSTSSRQTSNQMKGQAFRQGRDDRAKSSCRRLRRSGAERKGKTKRQDRDFSRRRRGQAFASRPTIRDRTDSPATLPSRVADRSPQGRKRTIVARYVFGDELKPGERWKRRLLSSR
jgi:hypothetical protein